MLSTKFFTLIKYDLKEALELIKDVNNNVKREAVLFHDKYLKIKDDFSKFIDKKKSELNINDPYDNQLYYIYLKEKDALSEFLLEIRKSYDQVSEDELAAIMKYCNNDAARDQFLDYFKKINCKKGDSDDYVFHKEHTMPFIIDLMEGKASIPENWYSGVRLRESIKGSVTPCSYSKKFTDFMLFNAKELSINLDNIDLKKLIRKASDFNYHEKRTFPDSAILAFLDSIDSKDLSSKFFDEVSKRDCNGVFFKSKKPKGVIRSESFFGRVLFYDKAFIDSLPNKSVDEIKIIYELKQLKYNNESIGKLLGELYNEFNYLNSFRWFSDKTRISAAIYSVCRGEYQCPIFIKKYYLTGRKLIKKAGINRGYDNETLFNNFVNKKGGELDLSKKVIDKASSFYSQIGKYVRNVEKAAAGALYIACEEEGEKRTQKVIAKVFRITDVTVRNSKNAILRILKT